MGTTTIAVVDDDRANRFVVTTTLSEYRVLEAESAAALRALLEAGHAVDLILLDVMMPAESGFEVAEKLARDARFRDIPILFLSARGAGEDVAQGFDLGAADYVKKPFDAAELRARVAAALNRRRERASLREHVATDALTGVLTRTAFFEAAAARVSYARRHGTDLAVAFVDLDDFKQVNDTLGHRAGDIVLKRTGTVLLRSVRDYDIVGRYGGEEFVVVFPEAAPEAAHTSLQRARSRLQTNPPTLHEQRIPVTFSAGVASLRELDEDDADLEQLLNLADGRLYQAKRTGKDRVVG